MPPRLYPPQTSPTACIPPAPRIPLDLEGMRLSGCWGGSGCQPCTQSGAMNSLLQGKGWWHQSSLAPGRAWHCGDTSPAPAAQRGLWPGLPEPVGFWGEALGISSGSKWWRKWLGVTLVSPTASRRLYSMCVGGELEVFVLRGRIVNTPVCGQLEARAVARVAGEQGCRALCLMPGCQGWFIFRSKTQGFLCAMLKFLLGAGAVCPSRVWGHP